ncbi:MAG: bifunctional riboflavin kinase/FAD synthetase [Bacteroidales bacterium]|nr:bifunctional riboflavin kinase/FAD synthetase [Bacteroidales bacterium]
MSLLILQAHFGYMVIYNGYNDLDLISPVVTLGIFDGVHRGHAALLERLVTLAKENNGQSVVITFNPHPRLVLDKNRQELSFLTTIDEKKRLLEKAGIDILVIIRFTRKFSRLEACDFVEQVLVQKIKTSYLVVGYDHHFGSMGKGDYDTIKQCAGSYGFRIEKVQGLYSGGGAISSTLIREALLKGNLNDASRWLGYNYSLKGSVVKGRGIGRSLGYPTANIKPADKYKLIPGDGVYAVEVILGINNFPGMLSIGKNPTIRPEADRRSIEVNIIDFSGDIYEKEIEVVFRHRLRDEIKFENLEQLSRQMKLDRENALQVLT